MTRELIENKKNNLRVTHSRLFANMFLTVALVTPLSFFAHGKSTRQFLEIQKDIRSLVNSKNKFSKPTLISNSRETWRLDENPKNPNEPTANHDLNIKLIIGHNVKKDSKSIVEPISSIDSVQFKCESHDLEPNGFNPTKEIFDSLNPMDEIQYNTFMVRSDLSTLQNYRTSIVANFISNKPERIEIQSKDYSNQDQLIAFEKNQNDPNYRFVVATQEEGQPLPLEEKIVFEGLSAEESMQNCQRHLNNLLFNIRSKTNYGQSPQQIFFLEKKIKNTEVFGLHKKSKLMSDALPENMNYFIPVKATEKGPQREVQLYCDAEKLEVQHKKNMGRIHFIFKNNIFTNGILSSLGPLKLIESIQDGVESSKIPNLMYYSEDKKENQNHEGILREGNIETKVFQVYETSDDDEQVEIMGSGSKSNLVRFPNYIIVMKYNRVTYQLSVNVMNFNKNYIFSTVENFSATSPKDLSNLLKTRQWYKLRIQLEEKVRSEYMSDNMIYFNHCVPASQDR